MTSGRDPSAARVGVSGLPPITRRIHRKRVEHGRRRGSIAEMARIADCGLQIADCGLWRMSAVSELGRWACPLCRSSVWVYQAWWGQILRAWCGACIHAMELAMVAWCSSGTV